MGNIAFESMIGIVGVCWMLRCLVLRDATCLQMLRHPLVMPWLAWLAAIVISLVWNGAGGKGWAHDIVFIRYLLYAGALLDVSRRLPIGKYMVWGLAAGVIWAAMNTVSAYSLGFDLLGKPLVRYTGKLKEASRISGMSVFAAPFFIIWGLLAAKARPKTRTILIGIGLVAFAQLLQTRIRTTGIAALAGIVFCLAFYLRKRVSLKIALGLGGLFVVLVGTAFYLQDMYQVASLYDRVYFWRVALTMWHAHPWVGVGISSFQDIFKEIAGSGAVGAFVAPDGIAYSVKEQTHAHNLFLMVMACTGLLGLGAFLWLFIRASVCVFKTTGSHAIGLASWPLVFFTVGLTGFNIYHSWYQALLAFFIVLIGVPPAAYGDESRPLPWRGGAESVI